MITILKYTIMERMKLFSLTWIIALIVEWFIFVEMTPLENYSYDYLVWLGYILLIGLLLLHIFRFYTLLYGKTLDFFRSIPVHGSQFILAYFIVASLEYICYFTPLYYFVSRSLIIASRIQNPLFTNQTMVYFMVNAVGNTGILFLALGMISYFCLLSVARYFKLTNRWNPLLLILLNTVLYLLLFWRQNILPFLFSSPVSFNPVSLFQYSSRDPLFYFVCFLFFGFLNMILMQYVLKKEN